MTFTIPELILLMAIVFAFGMFIGALWQSDYDWHKEVKDRERRMRMHD